MTKKTTLLAILSSLLLWLAWPPHTYLAPLLSVGFVPLLIALHQINQKADKKRGKKLFLTAGLAFFIWNTACIYWIFNSINTVNSGFAGTIASLLVSLLPYCFAALLMSIAFWLYFKLLNVSNNKILSYSGLISFYIALEYFYQSWDAPFPWMTLGNGFAGLHQLIQWYDITGVYGGSLWILLSNILAYEAWKQIETSKTYRLAGYWAALIIVPAAYSIYRYQSYQEKQVPVNVVAVQPNIDPYQKYEANSAAQQIAILKHLTDSVAQVNTEYIIWPETAIPEYADEASIRDNRYYQDLKHFINRYKNASLITGIETVRFYQDKKTESAKPMQGGGFYDNYNAAMQVENSADVQFYHKSKLVPGVEKLPFQRVLSFMAPVFAHFGGSTGGYGWQDEPQPMYAYSGIGVAPVICYESIWGDWVAGFVKRGAQFITVITNDGWWGNSSGKDQHLQYAKLRAIENRRYVVRSANTGISAIINQRGDLVLQSKWWTRTAIKADINLNDDRTFYTQNGDIIAQLLSGIAVLMLVVLLVKKKWKKQPEIPLAK
jgi:apolipoprotein N-acyltransferase